jgi:hypothetical protein
MFCVVQFCVVALALANAQSLPEKRMTIEEIRGSALDNNQIGSSGVKLARISRSCSAIPRKLAFTPFCYLCRHILPSKPTPIAMSASPAFCPANGISDTAIILTPHRSRRFRQEACIPSLPRELIMRGPEPVIVEICGFGPTDTRYFDPANDPRSKSNK